MPEEPRGSVVTFYSFKGGTGRTMALANIAWILAANGKRVLAADWDLESPGLHRFLHPFLDQNDLAATGGVIGLIHDFELAGKVGLPRPDDWFTDYAKVVPRVVPVNWHFPDGGSLDFLPAGSHNRQFSPLLLTVSWDTFFDNDGMHFLEALREDMRANYDYVLIDSRTGLGDVADVCTIHLPDTVVACFTLSEQGIDGTAEVSLGIDRHVNIRERKVRILPVPMRVDEGENEKANAGRAWARERFGPLPKGLSPTERQVYWANVEIPYRPFYAYEETLAVFGDPPGVPVSLLSAFERLTDHLTSGHITKFPALDETERVRTRELFVRKARNAGTTFAVAHVPMDAMWGEWIADVLRRAGFEASTVNMSRSDAVVPDGARIIMAVSSAFAESAAATRFVTALSDREGLGARHPIVAGVGEARPEAPFDNWPVTVLSGLAEQEAIEALLRAAGFGGQPGAVAPSDLTTRFPDHAPDVFEGVPTRNPAFTGRGEALTEMLDALRPVGGTSAGRPVVLYGLGGVGKTQLALEFAHRFQAEYDLIWWVTADQPRFIDTSMSTLAEHFNLRSDSPRVVDGVLNALRRSERYSRTLLIFDNADEPAQIKRFIPNGPRNRVLITSRNRDWADVARVIDVDVFQRQESLEHLTRRVPELSVPDAERIAATLGDLPIAIANAGALMAETGTTASDYLDQFNRRARETLSVVKSPNYPTDVAATWAISLEQLGKRSAAALRLYEICSVLASEIPMELITGDAMADILSELDPSLGMSFKRRTLTRELQRLALIKLDNHRDSVHVHRVVQLVVRGSMDPDTLAATRRDAHRVLAAARPSTDGAVDSPTFWPRYEQLWPHLEPSQLLESDLPRAWELMIDRVRYLFHTGALDDGREVAERVDEVWTQQLVALDLGHSEASDLRRWQLHLRFNLANILRAQGEYAAALALDEEVLDAQRRELGERDPHTLMTANSLAADLRAAGEHHRALALDEATHAGFLEIFGDRHARSLAVANNIAEDLRRLGRYDEARIRDTRVLQSRRSILGAEHRETLRSQANLARDYRELGDYDRSVKDLRDALAQCTKTLGEDAPYTLAAKVSLAVSLRANGELTDAYSLMSAAARQYTALYSDMSNPELLACRVNFSADVFVSGDAKRATRMVREAIGILEPTLGAAHPYTLACINNLAVYLRGDSRVEQATAAARQSFDGLAAALGSDHPHTLAAQMNLANCLADAGEHDAAERLDGDAAARLSDRLGQNHPDTLRCEVNLALSKRSGHSGDGSGDRFARTLAALAERLGDRHSVVVDLRMGKRADRILEPQYI
ncbi:MAG TPA: FxSxx-COOH system tetratricopeptide repeat protein [Vicinamibacterales bacterium]|nr:FxSxx-COOH system tetratricopeptide repeat protein [Vicinamibacterales bacterium]